MGNVVAFKSIVPRRDREKPDRPCEITIFPGVRYERHDTASLAVVAAEKAAESRRDRLDTDRR